MFVVYFQISMCVLVALAKVSLTFDRRKPGERNTSRSSCNCVNNFLQSILITLQTVSKQLHGSETAGWIQIQHLIYLFNVPQEENNYHAQLRKASILVPTATIWIMYPAILSHFSRIDITNHWVWHDGYLLSITNYCRCKILSLQLQLFQILYRNYWELNLHGGFFFWLAGWQAFHKTLMTGFHKIGNLPQEKEMRNFEIASKQNKKLCIMGT